MSTRSSMLGWRLFASLFLAFALVAAACGSDGDESEDGATDADSAEDTADSDTDAEAAEPEESDAEEPEDTEDDSGDADSGGDAPSGPYDFAAAGPATGEAISIGLVNTEGPAGLNFPELQEATESSIAYLNEHGGIGDRPVSLEVCVVDGSPESSQACAQELAGKEVEMVWLGLDLFPDYATYDAAGIPLVGVLPLFPADFASNAVYTGGGNATLAAANVYGAVEFFGAEKVAIISADNAGANSSEAAVIASLEAAGVEYRSIKGAESETDAGAQGLVREALSDDPDVLISLYGDSGCISMMRGRAALGSEVPVIAANTCSNSEVLEAVGDDAFGWYMVGGGDRADSPEVQVQKEALAPLAGVEPEDVRISDVGLATNMPPAVFTTAAVGNMLAADGEDVTGQAIVDRIKANPNGDIHLFPDGATLECGSAAAYPAVCNFSLFLGTYVGDGVVEIVPELLNINVSEYLG